MGDYEVSNNDIEKRTEIPDVMLCFPTGDPEIDRESLRIGRKAFEYLDRKCTKVKNDHYQ